MTERTANIITPEFRVSYEAAFAPRKNDLNGKLEYSVAAIFPKGADLTALKNAAAKIIADKFGADQSKWPANMRKPFRRCSERWKQVEGKQIIPAGYEDGDAIFLTLKSAQKPGIVGSDNQDIIDPAAFYSGAYARASVRPYFYDQKGNKGVSFGLQNIQKLRDGDRLGGRPAPQEEFEAVSGGSSSGAASVFD